MTKIIFAALDGAIANFGIARLVYDTDTGKLDVLELLLQKTEKSKEKQKRASSDDLSRAQQQANFVRENTKDCAVVFGEVPSGGKDAKATRAFGIITGIYASIERPFQEVTPGEVKIAAVGTRTASKEEMIAWAVEKFPNANWIRAKRDGASWKKGDLVADNEHLADAVAIGHAGVKTTEFRQMISMLKAVQQAA